MNKILKYIVALLLTVSVVICLTGCSENEDKNSSVLVRDAELEVVQSSLKIDSVYKNNYLISSDDDVMFEGELIYSEDVFNMIDEIAFNDISSDSNIKVACRFDMNSIKFILDIMLVDENENVLDSETYITDGIITENGNLDAFVELDENNSFYLSEFVSQDYIDNCLFGWIKRVVTVIAIVHVVIAETAEQIKAKSNYEFNRKLETENNGIKGVYKNTYVTNQTQTGFNGHNAGNYKFGFTTFEDVGCEVAAAYNLMISLGRAEYLSETIYSFEKLGIEFAFAWGKAGSNPLQMYHYFDNKGLGYKKITSWSTFKNYVSDKGNYKIVMSRWNDPFITGLHTFFIDKYNGNFEGFNFNYYSTSTENKTDITSYNDGDGFIVGYIIWIK